MTDTNGGLPEELGNNAPRPLKSVAVVGASLQKLAISQNRIIQAFNDLQENMAELKRTNSHARIEEIAAGKYAKEEARLTKLRDELMRYFEFAISEGLVSRERLQSTVCP